MTGYLFSSTVIVLITVSSLQPTESMIFIPTLPTPEGQEVPATPPGRFVLNMQGVTEEDSPGVLTIGTEVPWRLAGPAEGSGSSEAPYGTWRSPVTSSVVMTPRDVVVEPPQVDPVTGYVLWCAELSLEGKKNAVFHFNPETRETVRWTSQVHDVRNTVHEQGGGAFTIYNDTLFFSDGHDGAVYRQEGPGGVPRRLTTSSNRKYADGAYCPQLNGLFYVVEYLSSSSKDPEYGIVMVDADTGAEVVFVSHANFFASPRISQDGQHLVWLQWNYPRMDLTVVDLLKEKRRIIKTGYTSYSQGVAYSLDGSKVYVVAGDGVRYPGLVEVVVETGETREVSPVSQVQVDAGYLSTARLIQFPTSQGDFAYGYLYMPKNSDYHAPAGSKPPLLVKVHKGPTRAASSVLNMQYQFFTSRGFAVLDVDYRGSTGYGKLYRNKLNEMWGVYDVADVLAGARHLVEEDLVDADMLCIDGVSTAAYTTLSALTIPETLFKAGASFYGVSDPEMLVKNASKVKRNYVETLLGNLDKHKDRYVTRSSLRNHETLEVPTIFFHGTDDEVVPPSQAREMYEMVRNKSIPTAFSSSKVNYPQFIPGSSTTAEQEQYSITVCGVR
nr:uncharacterized peptidase YuxL-like isoform X2 [Cherax quadricarinatus]